MPVPDFQSMMLPFLQFASDRQEHELADVTRHLVDHFNLQRADIDDLLPTGKQTRLSNRVGWCRTHLKSAGLIEYVKRGVFRITPRGIDTLLQKPQSIDLKYLDQFKEHFEWFHRKSTDPIDPVRQDKETPEEKIASLIEGVNGTLAAEILERVRSMNPFRFERLVLDLLVAMGYGGSWKEAAMVTQKSNDEGIDGLINEDRLGLDRIYVQAKRWKNTVGRPEIQAFVGALAGKHAVKGIFITTSSFSQGATDFATSLSQTVILMDGLRLASLMVEHNVGVSVASNLQIKRIDSDYFEET